MDVSERPRASRRRKRLRLILLAALLVGLIAAGHATGVTEQFQSERVKGWVEAAGAWGFVLFVAAFSLGELLHVPGLVFVAAAIFVYGRTLGGALALVGAVIAVTVSFVFVRAVGGQPLAEIDRPLMQRILATIDERPIRAMILLRLIFLMFPPLNYALALTNIRLRHYVIGSAIGLAPPIALAALLFDWLFAAGWLR